MISFNKLGNMGRMANQLFQIATTISLALDNNDKYIFPYWVYENDFNLYDCFSHNIMINKEYQEPFFHYQPIPYQENLDLIGFFQSEKYFENNKDVILGLLTPKNGLSKKYNCTSIHVRRGDYLNLTKEYQQLTMTYYQTAMDMIKSKQYLICSDDIVWCKQNFIGNQFIFSENISPVADLIGMISCEHNIIANSSFSWWGAYLNKNPSKIVIAPKKWFGPALPHDVRDLIPETWIKI